MIIEHVLKKKIVKSLFTIKEHNLVSEAANLLSENNIGALPVTSDGKSVIGILSERDIVREIARHGFEALKTEVKDIMTKKVSTCSNLDTLRDVIGRMNKGRFRHMPVLENNEMVGFISISDLVLAHLDEVEFENAAMRGSVTGTN